jgi:type II secretory pathway pseudopilin PulG
MVKLQSLKKQLVKNAIIMLVAVSVTGAIAYSVFSWSSGVQEEAQQAQNRLNNAERDVNSRTLKNEDARKYLELYQRITGDDEQSKISNLNRRKAQEWYSIVSKDLHIRNGKGNFGSETVIAADPFKKKTLQGISSLVKLEFEALTDRQVYAFLDTLLTDFPGYVKITKFSMEKDGEITDAVLRSAGKGNFPNLVKTQFEFYWIGVREVAPEGEEGNN